MTRTHLWFLWSSVNNLESPINIYSCTFLLHGICVLCCFEVILEAWVCRGNVLVVWKEIKILWRILSKRIFEECRPLRSLHFVHNWLAFLSSLWASRIGALKRHNCLRCRGFGKLLSDFNFFSSFFSFYGGVDFLGHISSLPLSVKFPFLPSRKYWDKKFLINISSEIKFILDEVFLLFNCYYLILRY